MISQYKERTVVITGAAQGIGYGIAEAFAKNGDFVAICDINIKAANQAAEKLENAKSYQVDVSNEESVKNFVDELLRSQDQ